MEKPKPIKRNKHERLILVLLIVNGMTAAEIVATGKRLLNL
jgi:hypothetical protein